MGQQKDKIVFVLKLKWLVIKSTYRIISVFVEIYDDRLNAM